MRIAIVGSGISGLVAGYHLQRQHDLQLFEANDYIGGHTHTVDCEVDGQSFAIDTGFIVFNDRTYPNFIRLLDELGVQSQPTRMSFSVSCQQTGIEYSGTGLNGLFAQRKNLLNPDFYGLLRDFFRFSKLARQAVLADHDQETVEDFLARHRFSKLFIELYFFPMGASIWSVPFEKFSQFPIRFIAQFYLNHGLLDVTHRPQWCVIKGGSRRYIAPLTAGWRDRIKLNSPVTRVVRHADHVTVKTNDHSEDFDHVVFACHSDQALKILAQDADPFEREVLSAFPYQANTATLHTQATVLPKNRRAWACWNYFVPGGDRQSNQAAATVTYNMNLLQSIDSKHVFCVTLNDSGQIDPGNVIASFHYDHPTFSTKRSQMQARHSEMIDRRRTSFCGAWWGNGFHEDGVTSALAVVEKLNPYRDPRHE